MPLGPGNQDLDDVRRAGIVDRPYAGKRGEGRDRARTGPAMATDAGALEHHLAAWILRAAAIPVRWRRRRRRRRRQIGRGCWRHGSQIGDHGADVWLRQKAEAVIHRLAHRPRSGAVAVRVSDRKIGDQILVAPPADAGVLVRRDVEGAPTRRHRAGEFLAVVERECQVSRRMAFAAMRQRLGEIGAPVPFRALGGVGLETPIRIEQRRPEDHRPALVERKHQRIFGSRRAHRRQAEQIGLDRQSIRIGHVGIGRKRHRRIKPRAIAADAAMDRVEKILVAVIADAGLLVGRDVGRIQRAERQFEPEAAGIFLAVLGGVADHAIRGPRHISTALHKARLRESGRNAGGIGAAIIGERHLRAIREGKRTGPAENPKSRDKRNHHDRDHA